jgi:YegS/Rv2252/BmrU family lipid kinase
MKRKFIINPSSGQGLKDDELAQIKDWFVEKTGEFDHVITKNANDIVGQTQTALKNGFEQIIVVGGDGTIHHTINGFFEKNKLINSKALLAISDLGSGSDYFKTIVFESEDKDWKNFIINHTVKKVDLGKITVKDNKGTTLKECYFNNMASAGASAAIVQQKSNMPKQIPGALKYLIPTVQSLLTHKPQRLLLKIDNIKYDFNLLSLFISKGLFAGGGMRFAKDISINDGYFEITSVEKLSVIQVISKLKRLYSGQFNDIKEIKKFKAKIIQSQSGGNLKLELDGEYIGNCDFEIEIYKEAINLCFPAK